MLASGTASRPIKTWGLRMLSQRVSRAKRSASRRARSASSLKQSRRSRPPGRKISSTDPSGVAMAHGPSREVGTLGYDYDEPDPATQEALVINRSLDVATIAKIVISVSISDGKYGNEPGAGGPVYGTSDNDESATC